MYIDKLMNTIKHITEQSVNVKSSTYIDFSIKKYNKDPKFEVGDHERTSKYKNIFAKGYVPN